MAPTFVASPDDLAALIASGSSIALNPGDGPDVPMALAHAIVRRGLRDLHLVTLPTAAFPASGMLADILIGAGCVKSIETAGVSMSELGPAPRFTDAVRAGRLKVLDSTCPAIYAAINAGAKAQPFAALRGLIGSDILRHRSDYAIIQNPFATDDPVVVMKAINPDVAIFHVPLADREGNVWVGRGRTCLIAAHASRRVLVTAERIVDGNLMDDERDAAGTLPAFYVEAIAECPGGCAPMRMDGTTDVKAVLAYMRAAQSEAGFRAWLAQNVTHETEAADARA